MNRSAYQVRPFAAADQEDARELILAGLRDHFGTLDPAMNHDLDTIQQHYVAGGHTVLVAAGDNELIGTGALLITAPGVGRIVRMSVRHDWRRQRVGRTILDALVAAAATQGMPYLLVETNHDWMDAIGLYRHYGFTPYDRDDTSIYLEYERRVFAYQES